MLKRSLFAVFILLTGLVAWSPGRGQDAPDDHVVMGMPSKAGSQDKNDFLVKKKHYVLSYNNKKGTPNWVSWHLTKEHLGDAGRVPFRPDDSLPDTFKKVTPKDYTKSGFDRGHMCPHSDRSKTAEMSQETFFMTNMVPQSPENNQKGWNQLELFCRMLVEKKNKECYIVAGPAGVGGTGRNGKMTTTANGKVTVPAFTWKVIMVVPAGTTDPSQVKGSKTRLIAVIVPNDRTVTLDWASHRVSVEDVEELTDLKFFDKVTDEEFLEKRAEADQIPVGAPIPVTHDD
ncbi:MAG: non-specific endonuclease [Gemmataceae bacterium]|nr:non-specific endonuclease [Gemmataceae bacterium]